MKIRFGFIVLLILLATASVLAVDYSEDDLWILEIIINKDMASSQVTDALILDEQVYIPLARVASILKIPMNVNHDRGIYSFVRPGDQVPIVVDLSNQVIQINDSDGRLDQEMFKINGELFLPVEAFGQLMDAEFVFVEEHLVVYITTEHLAKKEKQMFPMGEMNENTEEVPPFSISNIKYKISAEWEKHISEVQIRGANAETDNFYWEDEDEEEQSDDTKIERSVEESWKSALQLDMKGTIYNWDYSIGGEITKTDQECTKASLTTYLLTYDMDQANFYLGKLYVNSEPELSLERTTFDGVSLVSKVSPLFRMNGNLIQVTGEAPKGSKVKLYVNGWLVDELLVNKDEIYIFKDVLLSYSDMVNEMKITIKKPDGEVEELYRYISVSESILNPGEVDYLVQAGKLKTDDCTGNYLWNSIAYWGVNDQTTLGLSWYGELEEQRSKDLLAYNYNSLRINHRLSDYLITKGVLYNIYSTENGTEQQDMGYKLNLDYKNLQTQAGISYHKEGRNFKQESEEPYESYRLYVLQTLDQQSQLEGKLGYDIKVAEPKDRRQLYQMSYKTSGENWVSSINARRDEYLGDDFTWNNSLHASLGYLIRPNVELLQSVKYKGKWNQRLTEELGVGLEGIIDIDTHNFVLGLDWNRKLTDDLNQTDYSLSWRKRYELTNDQFIQTNLGYQYQCSGTENQHIIPLSIQYSYILPNEAKLNLSYNGQWEKSSQREEFDHKIAISLEGAFNFFGGKLVSTSPHLIHSQVGIVSGMVFKDANRNGQIDQDEQPLVDIPVRLGRKVQFTDHEGKFTFINIPHGVHYLGFDYSQLPIEMTPSTADKNVKVEANGEVIEYLGLYVVGAVDGMIIVEDLPASLSLNNIKLVALPGDYTAYTDRYGYYYFDQLPPGNYMISIDPATLPDWVMNQEIEGKPVEITDAGEYIGDLDFDLLLDPNCVEEEAAEQAEVIVVESKSDEAEEMKEEPRQTIEGIEERLIDLNDQILKVDLSTQTATFNGEPVCIDPFFFKDEKIWAPIRSIAQLFDCRVFWDVEARRVYIVDQDRNILFDIEIGYVMVNGENIDLENGIRLVDEFTFITLEDINVIGLTTEMVDDTIFIYPESKK